MTAKTDSPIVITTIFPPNKVISAYTKKGHQLVIVGDKKTQEPWLHPNSIYLSVKDQENLFKSFAKKLPYNHYGRKNLGYLYAMKMADSLIETDDDNYPLANYPNFTSKEIKTDEVSSSNKFINTYDLFRKNKSHKIPLWPRGYPLSLINQSTKLKKKKIKKKFFIQQGLVDGDTDVDAIYRLVFDQHVTFKANYKFALAPHNYAPVNTQNTFWTKEAFLFLYLPVFASFRSCDIIKGWIAQRMVWELDSSVLFTPPSVVQKRNPHDYLKDFDSEIPLYLETQKMIGVLETVKLTGSIENKFIQVYEALIRENLIDKRELPLVKTWVKQVAKIVG